MAREPNYALALPAGVGWVSAAGGAAYSGRIAAVGNIVAAVGVALMDPALPAAKIYAETYARVATTDLRIGFSTNAVLGSPGTSYALGADVYSVGVLTDGRVLSGGVLLGTIVGGFAADDRICFAVDWPNAKFWVRRNDAAWLGGDPATGSGGYSFSTALAARFGASMGQNDSAAICVDTPLFAAPSGFSNLTATTPMPNPTQVSGVVQVEGVAQSGLTVRAYDANNGQLLGAAITDVNGAYEIDCLGRSVVFVTAHDLASFDALIHDGVQTQPGVGGSLPTGQVLVFDFVSSRWVVATGFAVPAGGTVGQTLIKSGAADGVTTWATPSAPEIELLDAHRYWRLSIQRAVVETDRVRIAELRFLETPTSSQVAPTGGVAACNRASEYTGAEPDAAFDGNAATHWSPFPSGPYGSNLFISYAFAVGDERGCRAVAITSEAAGVSKAPRDFSVQWSDDGTTWTTAWTVTGATWTSGGQTQVFAHPTSNALAVRLSDMLDVRASGATAGQVLTRQTSGVWAPQTPEAGGGGAAALGAHRYWMLDEVRSGSAVAIAEIAFRATPGGANLTISNAVAKDSYDPGSTGPNKSHDGDAGTFWAAASSPSWIYFDLGSAQEVQQIAITARNDGWHAQRPTDFNLLCSDDGVSWTQVRRYMYPVETSSGATILVSAPTTR